MSREPDGSRHLTVALAQARPDPGNTADTVDKAVDLIARAAGGGSPIGGLWRNLDRRLPGVVGYLSRYRAVGP